jgi:hypothetical protein
MSGENHRMIKTTVNESRLDSDAKKVREELLKRKLARDRQRQLVSDRTDDVLRKFAAKDAAARS